MNVWKPKMGVGLAVTLLVGVSLAASLWSYALMRREIISVTPQTDTVFLSSRYITSIAVAKDGTVWASSYGGLLHGTPDGSWERTTCRDGLPSNEVRRVIVEGESVRAETTRGCGDVGWQALACGDPAKRSPRCRIAIWRGAQRCRLAGPGVCGDSGRVAGP